MSRPDPWLLCDPYCAQFKTHHDEMKENENEEPPVTEAELARVAELDAQRKDRVNFSYDARLSMADLLADLTPRLARELAAARAAITELEHSLEIALKGKRPFTPKLADEVISGQVKQITKLQDELAAIREWTPAMEYNDPTSRFHLKAWRLRTASGKPVWEQPPTAALTQLNTHTHE